MNSFYLRASQFQDRVELPPKGAPANLPKHLQSNADEMPCECVDCGNRHTSIQSCGDMIEERLKRLAARRSGVEADPKPNTFVQRAQDPNI